MLVFLSCQMCSGVELILRVSVLSSPVISLMIPISIFTASVVLVVWQQQDYHFDVQSRLEVNIPELPDKIDMSS